MKNDIYAQEIKRLKNATSTELWNEWCAASPLFRFVTPHNDCSEQRFDGKLCGCLTSVRRPENVAWTTKLTQEIKRDKRIPVSPRNLKPKHLPVFAEWQRKIDKELKRNLD